MVQLNGTRALGFYICAPSGTTSPTAISFQGLCRYPKGAPRQSVVASLLARTARFKPDGICTKKIAPARGAIFLVHLQGLEPWAQ